MTKQIRKSAEDRKKQIVETAIRLAGNLGPKRLTTQQLAYEIGVSQAAIFRHFPTKGHIWLAVAEHISRFMGQNTKLDGAKPGQDVLLTMAKGHLNFVQRTPAVPAILFSQELHSENADLRAIFTKLMARNHAMFSRVVTQEISAGNFRADLDADDAAYLVLALIQGLAMRWSLNDRDFDLPAEGERLLKVQLRAFT